MAKLNNSKRLPNAPLAEAVFELRWKLRGPSTNRLALNDPGFPVLLEQFTSSMKKIGFGVNRNMGGPDSFALGHSVARRFFKKADAPFPLMQIGPGLFATNQASEYDWPSFKKQTISGVTALLKSYPDLGILALEPEYLELRYADVFDSALLGHSGTFDFINEGTALEVRVPDMLADLKLFASERAEGRVIWSRPLKNRKDSKFAFDIGSAIKDETVPVIRLESKVLTGAGGVPKLGNPRKFLADLEDWLEFAHTLTSPFFQRFVKPAVMAKFEKKK